jgi:hypothetical protein
VRRLLLGVGLGILAIASCTRPVDRPREGAQPVLSGGPAGALQPVPPPTVAPAPTINAPPPPEPPPAPTAPAALTKSGGLYPLVTNMQPAPNTSVPPGDVTIAARVTGAGNLVEVRAFVGDEPYQPALPGQPARSAALSFIRRLDIGTYEVRIEARDDQGQARTHGWQFSVGARRLPPTLTPAPDDVPGLRPTVPVPLLPTLGPR